MRRTPLRLRVVLPTVLVSVALLSACNAPLQPETAADKTTPPKLGACYNLTPADIEASSNETEPVPCAKPHTAETFAIGTLPDSTGKDYSSKAHGKWIYARCGKAFEKFLGVDESLAMRIQLSWAWFRPSERGWDKGARWYRCDLVGGPEDAKEYAALPTTAKGLFRARPPEQWLTCAQGETVAEGKRVPCSVAHNWRAVTTIKLGGPDDSYPGDRVSEVRSRDFCSDSVGAWMNYPVDYEFGYTWFHEAEWQAGNRRSICWAKTDR
jgi:hypothetical protein